MVLSSTMEAYCIFSFHQSIPDMSFSNMDIYICSCNNLLFISNYFQKLLIANCLGSQQLNYLDNQCPIVIFFHLSTVAVSIWIVSQVEGLVPNAMFRGGDLRKWLDPKCSAFISGWLNWWIHNLVVLLGGGGKFWRWVLDGEKSRGTCSWGLYLDSRPFLFFLYPLCTIIQLTLFLPHAPCYDFPYCAGVQKW
jgi:hypothetical protein